MVTAARLANAQSGDRTTAVLECVVHSVNVGRRSVVTAAGTGDVIGTTSGVGPGHSSAGHQYSPE